MARSIKTTIVLSELNLPTTTCTTVCAENPSRQMLFPFSPMDERDAIGSSSATLDDLLNVCMIQGRSFAEVIMDDATKIISKD